MNTNAMLAVLGEVRAERMSQEAKWGQQNHANGTGKPGDKAEADFARAACEGAFASGAGTYRDILLEEVAEAFAESDPHLLRTELLQVAAVAVAWVEKIDRDLAGGCGGCDGSGCAYCEAEETC